jgi:uncharacterized protein (DUF1778 family)
MAAKTQRLEMRLTGEQKDLIERAARLKGLDVTSFAVPTLLDVAREVVGQQSLTTLSARDFKRFLQILDADEEPAPKLKAAVKRLNKLRG